MRKFMCLIVLAVCGVTWGTTYYLDATGGSDSANGTSTGTAWQTVNKVVASSFSAGDIILFKKGEIFRGCLLFPSAGTTASPIRVTSYGTSTAKPKLLASKLADEFYVQTSSGHIAKDDFESGSASASAWSSTSGITVGGWGAGGYPAAPTGGGTKGCKIITNDAPATAPTILLSVPYACVWLEGMFYYDGSSSYKIFTVYNSSDTKIGSLRMIANNASTAKFQWYKNIGSAANVISSTFTPTSGWIKVTLQLLVDTVADGTRCKLRAWADSDLMLDLDYADSSSTLTNWGTSKIKTITVGINEEDSTIYCDNIRISRAKFDSGSGLYVTCIPNARADATAKIYKNYVSMGNPQASLVAVNAVGEWYFDSNYDQFYLYDNPSGYTIDIPVIHTIGDNGYEDVIRIVNGKNDLIFEDLYIGHAYSNGVDIVPTSSTTTTGIVVNDCTMYGFSYSGIGMVYDSNYITITNNNISNFEHGGIVSNLKATNNDIPSNILIDRNVIHDGVRQGIASEMSNNLTIINNTIYNIAADSELAIGIQIGRSPTADITSGMNAIVGNTVYGCDQYAVEIGQGDGSQDWRAIVKNNILYATGNTGCFYFYGLTKENKQVLLDNNCYWAESASSTMINSSNGTYNRTEFDSFKTTSGQEINGICSNPLFKNAASGDFSLRSGSTCVDLNIGGNLKSNASPFFRIRRGF